MVAAETILVVVVLKQSTVCYSDWMLDGKMFGCQLMKGFEYVAENRTKLKITCDKRKLCAMGSPALGFRKSCLF